MLIFIIYSPRLTFLDRRVPIANLAYSNNEDWQPLTNYRTSLLHGETDQVNPIPVAKKVYARKGKKNQEDEDETV